jgi:hypothetical protein
MMGTFNGLQIIISANAQKVTWNWPDKKRSKRLIKKLTRLRGPQITTEPQAYRMGGKLIIHPDLYQALKQRSARDTSGFMGKSIF